MSEWAKEPESGGGGASGSGGGMVDALADRTALISARLKQIYKKSVLPCEQRYRYDYFYESPLLSDVEFDGTSFSRCVPATRQCLLVTHPVDAAISIFFQPDR